MTRFRGALIFALGFFALAAQTLLFRDFLTAFEGNELAVGAFFAFWFLWIAVGALIARNVSGLTRVFAPLTLLYIPAFIVEHYLILAARSLAGVAAYDLFPFARMFAFSALTNAPVSFLTGLLFTAACAWWNQAATGVGAPLPRARLPVARVYALETLGAAAGGIVVTVLPLLDITPHTLFLFAAAILAASAGSVARSWLLRTLPLLACLAALAAGAGNAWTTWDARWTWSRLLPPESYRGRFMTAQAEYLYGEREGQFVVLSGGGAVENLPGAEQGAEIVALTVAQRPDAKDILVIGPGALSTCLQFVRLPQTASVTWLATDPDYAARLRRVLPAPFREALDDIQTPRMDARRFLAETSRQFDLVVLQLPEAATLIANRFHTREFLSLVKHTLRPDGIAALQFAGASNVLGPELALLGASVTATFERVFPRTALKPGEASWLLGSQRAELSESPVVLRDRFASIPGAAEVFPPDALRSLYPMDRIAFQRTAYRGMTEKTPEALLANTDAHPKALIYALLLALRQAGFPASVAIVRALVMRGAILLAVIIVLYVFLRYAYTRRRHPSQLPDLVDNGFLLFTAGLTGMASSVVLLFAFQAAFGSLYLHIGLLSALFMLGAFAGSAAGERVLADRGREPALLAPGALLLHLALLGIVAWSVQRGSVVAFAGCFAGAGVFTGFYFPLAAFRMRESGVSDAPAGALLEALDHVGAAVGALLTGLILLPLFGAAATLGLLALLVAANLTALRRSADVQAGADAFERWPRPAGYFLLGAGLFAVIASNVIAAALPDDARQAFENAARALLEAPELTVEETTLPDGRTISCYRAFQKMSADATQVSVFNSADLAPDVVGFAGPITLAVAVDADGELQGVRVAASRETPAYLAMTAPWMARLRGIKLFDPAPFAEIDAVSGATITSQAVLRTIEVSAREIAPLFNPGASPKGPRITASWFDANFWWLTAFTGGALIMRSFPGRWRRRAFLLAVVLVLGMRLNLQYSAHHAVSALAWSLPLPRLTGAFFMVALVPLCTLLWGNVYCGYLCPFGALQELIGDLRPKSLATDPDKRVWRWGRLVKYLLLFLLVLRFALSRDFTHVDVDPLTTFFSVLRDRWTLLFGGVLIALSFPYRRFWCRNLCPAGAFLALLNRPALLRKLSPPTHPARCDLGVRRAGELDCIRCDRCAHENK